MSANPTPSSREAPQATWVAAAQMTSTPDVAQNLDRCEQLVKEASERRVALVVLPEGFAYMGPEAGKLDLAETLPEGGPVLDRCKALARDHHIAILAGGYWERSPGSDRVRNSCIHIDETGAVVAIYRKIHLFDVELPDGLSLKESRTVEPGTDVVTTETPFGILGLSICYDLRFPELYRKLVDQGAVALAVPSAFTATTGKDHWHVLLRARAIEAQCYVIAAAQTGRHYDQRFSYGHALVCDPWGCIVAECSEGEGLAIAKVEPERVTRARNAVPSLKHRRVG
jgi:deaminated glutathione amidase